MPSAPGWGGSTGPSPSQYNEPHVYARDIHSGAGNCVCGMPVGHWLHIQAAPGVPVPDRLRSTDRYRCSCTGCWACTGHVVDCTCDVDWDALFEARSGVL